MHDSRSPPEPTLIPSRGFLTPPGGQLVQTLVGHSKSAVYGLAASSDGKYAVTGHAEFFQYILFLGKPYGTCKRTQHCWAKTPNIVGCYMLRPFAHPVACFCVLLGVVAESLKPVKLLAPCKRRQLIVSHCCVRLLVA